MKKFWVLIIITLSIPAYTKDYHKTEEIIKNILTEESSEAEIRKQTGSAEKGEEKKQEAEADDEKKENKPSQAMTGEDEVLLKTGIQLYESSMFDHSQINFSELLKKFPSSRFADSARIWSGKIDLKKYRYDSAIKKFGEIKSGSGEYPASIYYTAEAYRFKGNSVLSIEQHQKLASSFPDHELADDSILISGKLYIKTSRGYQALESAIRIIRHYRNRETVDDAYYLIAKIYEKDPVLKDIESARKMYNIFLKKAGKGEEHFSSSPLLGAVKKDLQHLEKNYFRMER